MKRSALLLFTLLIMVLTCGAQELTVRSMEPAPFDRTASMKPVLDYNNVACGLVKVQLAAGGAEFGGNIIPPVKHEVSEYWVYMTAGSKMLKVQCPGFLPMMVYFRDYGIQKIESQLTYILTLVMPDNSNVPVDDGMRYFVVNVKPANAVVYVDDQMYTAQDGSASVLLSRGTHSYRVEAMGYSPKSGTVEIADSKVTVDVELESALAQLTVNCPTTGAKVYVNGNMKGTAPWSGQLSAGNYQIEARLDGHRPQKQSLALEQKARRTIDLPALTPIVGVLNVNYKPVNSEVWMDGKKLGTSPDVFHNVLVGSHSVEIRKGGYQTDKKTVTISEGQTAQLSGSLTANAITSSSNAITSSSNAITSSSNATASSPNAIASSPNATVPVPEAIDLGLSVKWASFNLGASKPEEAGYYYKWGDTKPTDAEGWKTYKYANAPNYNGDANLTKYCTGSYYGNNGFVDGKTVLEPMDDAATTNLGSEWRMPTKEEIEELISKCKREWTKMNGVNGIRVTGPNGNTVFFPASGYYTDSDHSSLYEYGMSGDYWSATTKGSGSSFFIVFGSDFCRLSDYNRPGGFSVRPVLAE